ncbi:MAG: hypothetical protein QNJ45_11755 [Ardenticatenaceae bacterium]|nr:hypothetical protein [Ardenticatenaceae bacterium]
MSDLHFRAQVPVFDANVRIGDRRDEVSAVRNRAELLAEMDRHGVSRALIYHAQGEFLSPLDGNEYLQHWLDGGERLEAQWMVMPTAESIAQVKAAHQAGVVRAVRLYDTRHAGLPFRPWAYDELLSWLSECRLPLWIALPDMDLHELLTTLQQYPDLVTVHVGAHYSHHLWVRPLLNGLPNAYLELSRYEPIGGIEALIAEFGAGRLLYGSWFNRYAMGPILFYLHRLGLSEPDLKLICAKNLERLLGVSSVIS